MAFVEFDNRGIIPQVGDEVAFNLSGQIAKGKIKMIKKGVRYGRPIYVYHIELLHDAAGFYEGHISKVRDSTSLLVLRSYDGD